MAGRDTIGATLVTIHNIHYLQRLMERLRQSIIDGVFPEFVQSFMDVYYPNRSYPSWAVAALFKAGIDLTR